MHKSIFSAIAVIPPLVCVFGFITLAVGPYTGLRCASESGRWKVASVAVDSPFAPQDARRIEGSTLVGIGSVRLGPNDLLEDFDYIETREGVREAERAQAALARILVPGQDAEFSFVGADGNAFKVAVIIAAMPVSVIVSRGWIMWTLGLVSLVVGYAVAMRKPRAPDARAFFAVVFWVASIFCSFAAYTSRDLAMNALAFRLFREYNGVFFYTFPFVFLAFCFVFPFCFRFYERRAPRVALATLAAVGYILMRLRVGAGLSYTVFMLGLILGTAALVAKYTRPRSLVERYQIRWVLAATCLFAIAFLAVTVLPMMLLGHRLFTDRIPSLFFVLIPISVGVAIERYRLMNIDTIIDFTLVNVVAVAALSAIDLAAAFALDRLVPVSEGAASRVRALMVIWVLFACYWPVRNVLSSWLKGLTGRRAYDAGKETGSLAGALALATTRQEAVSLAVERIESLFSPMSVAVEPAHVPELSIDRALPPSLARRARNLAATLCAGSGVSPAPRYAWSLDPEVTSEAIPGIPDLAEALFLPIGSDGCMILFRKRSGSLYGDGDIRLLGAFAAALELSLGRIESHERAEAERYRVAREIHDGVGGALGTAMLQLDMAIASRSGRPSGENGAVSSGAAAPTGPELESIRGQIDRALSDLRALVGTLNDRDQTVLSCAESIVERLRLRFSGTGIDFEADVSGLLGPGGQRPLDATAALDIVMVFQELATNAIRHSGARRAEFFAEVEGGEGIEGSRLRLSFADDGKGLRAVQGATRGQHYGLRNLGFRIARLGAQGGFRDQDSGTLFEMSLTLAPGTIPAANATASDREETRSFA